MSDQLNPAADSAASFGTAAVLAAGAEALKQVTAKATLYIRIIGREFNDTSGATTNQDVAALRNLLKKRKKTSKNAAKAAGSSSGSVTSLAAEGVDNKMTEAEMAAAMLSIGFMPMDVQYNPATLRMNTVGGNIQKYTAMGNENQNTLTSTDKKTSTYLTVQLVFEDINNDDAFGLSGEISLSASSAVNKVGAIASEALAGGYSVRTPVEGLISLLMLKRTRQVIFVWNDIFFHGELISVDANFTMFNNLGHPIKATVDMQIQQTNSNATFKSDLQYWDDVLDLAFPSGT